MNGLTPAEVREKIAHLKRFTEALKGFGCANLADLNERRVRKLEESLRPKLVQ